MNSDLDMKQFIDAKKSLVHMIEERVRLTPQHTCSCWKDSAVKPGDFRNSMSYAEMLHEAELLASGLHAKLRVKRKDIVLVYCEADPKFRVIDWAVKYAGGIIAALYTLDPLDMLVHKINLTQARVLFLETPEQFEKIQRIRSKIPSLQFIIDMSDGSVRGADYTLSRLGSDTQVDVIRKIGRSLRIDDTCALVFTSGSTGLPKAAVVSHRNFMYGAWYVQHKIRMVPEDRHLDILPPGHIMAMFVNYYIQYMGLSTYYGSRKTLMEDLVLVQPEIFISAPITYENIAKALQKRVPSFILDYALSKQPGNNVLKKFLLKRVGLSRGKYIISGGAKLGYECNKFWQELGLHLREGYGLSETTAANLLRDQHDAIGTMRPFHEDIKFKVMSHDGKKVMRVGERGIIWTAGHMVAKGYHRNIKETHHQFVRGWFNTGDEGQLNPDGSLTIFGRSGNLFKLPNGELVRSHAVIEYVKSSTHLADFVYVPSTEKEVKIIVAPALPELKELFTYLKKQGMLKGITKLNSDIETITNTDLNSIFSQYQVHNFIRKQFEKLLDSKKQEITLSKVERIKSVIFVPRLSVAEKELTPTLKLNNSVVHEHFKKYLTQVGSDEKDWFVVAKLN